MNSSTEWDEICGLPIAAHRKISDAGESFAHHSLTMPAAWLPDGLAPTETYLGALGPLYFRQLRSVSRGLIRVERGPTATRFWLWPLGLTLLAFGPPTLERDDRGGWACFPIHGGLALARSAPRQGMLCLGLHRVAHGLRPSMEVRHYYPWLMGSGQICALRRHLYVSTQATLHERIARDYVRRVALAMRHGELLPAQP